MKKVRGVLGILFLNVVFFGGLVLWTALCLPLAFVAWCWQTRGRGESSRMALRNLIHRYGVVCCKLFASQVPVTVDNRAGTLPSGCIIVANHQSFFDPYCIGFFAVPAPVFVVRAWPFRIPIYGRIMRLAGYLDAEALGQEGLLRRAGDVLREGATLVVFPEGTRSTSGAVGRFRSGAFALALGQGVPVIPMCIKGTGGVFPKGSRWGRHAPVHITLLPPVYPSAFCACGDMPHRSLQKHVKHAIQDALDLE